MPKDAVVYTSHSIEQIPTLDDSFVHGLIRRAPRLVVHFEPCYDDQDDKTLIGLMRRRYIELNDYNRNLLGLLRSVGTIEALPESNETSPNSSLAATVPRICRSPLEK